MVEGVVSKIVGAREGCERVRGLCVCDMWDTGSAVEGMGVYE